MLWIPATSHYWCCWIFLQRLMVLTTAFFSSGCRSHTAFTELLLAGLLGTFLVEVSTSALQHPNPQRHLSCTACRKGRSSGRSCLSCMSLTYCSWWKITVWCLTHTRMISSFVVFVVCQSPKHCRTACPTAWMLLDRGWLLIAPSEQWQDRSTVVFIRTTATSDPDETCKCRKCISTASRHCPESWGLSRCWCYHARSCDLNCPGVFCYTTPDIILCATLWHVQLW